MFQHSAEPSKTFLHTKIYLSSKSLLSSCCSFHKGHTIVTVSSSPTLIFTLVWLTLLSCHSGHWWCPPHIWWCPPHMSRSHWLSLSLCTVSVFPLAQRWYLPASPGLPDRPMRRRSPVEGGGPGWAPSASWQHWHGPVSAPRVRTLALQPQARPPTQLHCAAHLTRSLRGKQLNGRG